MIQQRRALSLLFFYYACAFVLFVSIFVYLRIPCLFLFIYKFSENSLSTLASPSSTNSPTRRRPSPPRRIRQRSPPTPLPACVYTSTSHLSKSRPTRILYTRKNGPGTSDVVALAFVVPSSRRRCSETSISRFHSSSSRAPRTRSSSISSLQISSLLQMPRRLKRARGGS